MSKPRNIITLSNMDPDLEEWARNAAQRKNMPFYEVINQALRISQAFDQSGLEVSRVPQQEEKEVETA